MSYNLTSAAGLEDIPDSDIEELSQSQSVRSDSDPDYVPPPSSSADELSGSAQSDNEESLFYQYIDAKKAIIFLPSLLQLFSVCRVPGCGSAVDQDDINIKTNGAMVSVACLCNSGHKTDWDSGPMLGTGTRAVAVINILLATYCLITGLHLQQILDFFQHLRIWCFGKSFFYNLQEKALQKIIWAQWQFQQKKCLDMVKENQISGYPINLASDGKYDSPGFTAAYCTYTVQDLRTQAIVGIYVAHKNQVKSSSEMEPFAAKTLLLNLAVEHSLQITSITTDRSSSVKTAISELAEELPEDYSPIVHYYDIWHFIKSILKDLWKACKLKTCSDLQEWIPSITNQLWWSFSSSI